jgi:AcrR family transcriptional regulator
MPRRTENAQPTRREQILAAAAELFARYGFHGVGIDDIGAAVGISGPALYRHFRSKDAMLAEMLTGISDRLLAGGRTRVHAARDPRAALDDLVRWHVEFAMTHPALITIHMRDLDSLGTEDRHHVRELQRTYVEVWVDTLRTLRPELDPATARATAHAALGLINSTPYSALLDAEAMSALLRTMALAALTATG